VIGRRAKVVSCRVGAKPHYSDTTRLVADLSTTRQTISTCPDGQLPRDFPAGTWSRPTSRRQVSDFPVSCPRGEVTGEVAV